jgi:prevent-host-death family protein
MCYIRRMSSRIAARDLRNNTAELLRRVDAGEEIVITRRGAPVAALVPFRPPRPRWLSRAEWAGRLSRAQADPALRDDLARLVGQSTDEPA